MIGILNSDDFYHDEHVLEDINSAMDGQPVDCVYGDLKFVQAYNTDRVVRIWKGSQHKNGAFLQEVKKQENNTERKYKSALFVGHVVPTKGVVELVEGCSKVSGLSLRIVGKCSDEMKEKLCSLAKERGNGNWLSVVGEIPHTEVIGEMLRADAFVFPSYTEAFPNVILEAMACGCAIVASDVGAIPEMLDYKGASAGICFIPNSVDEVTKAVNTLYQDNDYRIQLSEMAKDKVLNTYTTNKVWLQLVRTWDSVNKHNLP